MSAADGVYREGVELHRGGRLAEAWAKYTQALQMRPDHASALHQMGVIALQGNRPDIALELLGKSLHVNPDSVAAYLNRGRAEYELQRYEAALQSFRTAIRLKPDAADGYIKQGIALAALGRPGEALASYDRGIGIDGASADAFSNRGVVLEALERREQALSSYDRAIHLNPAHAQAFNNRAVTLGHLDRHDQALADYDRAIAIDPNYAEAHNNRGVALRLLGRLDEALASCDRAIATRPDHPDAYCNRGVALRELRRYEDALASFDRAIALDGRHAASLNDRAVTLVSMRRFEEAHANYEQALKLLPHSADLYNNFGFLLGELGRYDHAIACFDKCIALAPGNAAGHFNRGTLLTSLKRYEAGLESFDRALALEPDTPQLRALRLHNRLHICEWKDFDAELAAVIAAVERGVPSSDPLSFLALCGSAALQRRLADNWARREYPAPAAAPTPARSAGGRIRIGYFSADFREHAVATLTARLFEIHDRTDFEWTAFSFGPDTQHPMRRRMEQAFDRFIDVKARSDAEIVTLARSLGIDVAVDLGGYTQHCRPAIFALRAAPVQVGFLGYPGTMGGGLLDYLVADPVVVPKESRQHYAERIIEMPHSYLPSDSGRPIAARVFRREELALPASGMVYCCFNASYKITPHIFAVWMRILRRVEGSVLWLSESNPTATQNLRRHAAAAGVDPKRLVFAGRLTSADEHLARLRLAGLFLDTLPYNAHSTASDALWAGVPVLTCPGEGFAARVAASLLTAAGLTELIAEDLAHYEERAVRLGQSPDQLADLRAKLTRERNTMPLFDIRRFARDLESAYRTVDQVRRSGTPARR